MLRRIVGLTLLALCLFSAGLAEEPANPLHAAMEDVVTQFVLTILKEQANQTNDGWVRFISEQGASDFTMNLNQFDITKGKPLAVSFKVAGAKPDMKALPKYNDKPAEWLQSLSKDLTKHTTTVKLNVMLIENGNGYFADFAPKAEAAFTKSLSTIAATAKKAFGNKTISTALSDYLLPRPIKTPSKAPKAIEKSGYLPAFMEYVSRHEIDLENDSAVPALLYAVKSIKLDVSGGPKSFVLSYTVPLVDELFDTAAQKLGRDLCYDRRAKQYEAEALSKKLTDQFTTEAIAYRHGKSKVEEQSYQFSILDLTDTPSVDDIYSHATRSPAVLFNLALMDVQDQVDNLPDYPAVAAPKTGLISGHSSGTKCIFKTLKDGYDHCVIVYRNGSSTPQAVLFIADGKSTTIKIPKGTYSFVVGRGDVWYGSKYFFGNRGSYSETEDIDIASSSYYHTFTLNPDSGGNTDLSYVNYNDLIN